MLRGSPERFHLSKRIPAHEVLEHLERVPRPCGGRGHLRSPASPNVDVCHTSSLPRGRLLAPTEFEHLACHIDVPWRLPSKGLGVGRSTGGLTQVLRRRRARCVSPWPREPRIGALAPCPRGTRSAPV